MRLQSFSLFMPRALEADTEETLAGEFGALFDWLTACLERGSVEEYEFRVSCY